MQSHPGFELVSTGPFPRTITITPRGPSISSIASVFFFGWLSLGSVFLSVFGYLSVSQNPRELYTSDSPWRIVGFTLVIIAKFRLIRHFQVDLLSFHIVSSDTHIVLIYLIRLLLLIVSPLSPCNLHLLFLLLYIYFA